MLNEPIRVRALLYLYGRVYKQKKVGEISVQNSSPFYGLVIFIVEYMYSCKYSLTLTIFLSSETTGEPYS